MTIMSLIITGLFTTALLLWPALELKKRRKWHGVMGVLMLLAGVGTVGIAVWLARLLSGVISPLIVGGAALVVFLGFAFGVAADLFPDKKVDHPWRIFALPPLIAIVFMTSGPAFDAAKTELSKNVSIITSEMK